MTTASVHPAAKPSSTNPEKCRSRSLVGLADTDDDESWYKNTDHSPTGVAAELGVILRLKGIALSAGYNTINFKYHQVTAGIGLIF